MLKVNKTVIQINHFTDGTLLLKDIDCGGNQIEWKFESNEELVALYFIVKQMQEKGLKNIELLMKYIPNARQDRVVNDEDVFTLKYFANLINSLAFARVFVLDAHSNVALALIHRVKQLAVKPYIEKAIQLSGMNFEHDIVFYPDEGSQKRYAGQVNVPHAFGHKKRCWENGKILSLDVIGDVPEKPFNVLIIDDISSFGGTFYHAAKKLKELGAEKVYLYITHCENSIISGDLIKSGLVERIYTTDSLFTAKHEKITIL